MFCLLSGDHSVDLVTTNINLLPGLRSCSEEQDVKVSHSFIQVQLLNMLIFTQKGCGEGSEGSSTARKSHRRQERILSNSDSCRDLIADVTDVQR